MSLFLSQMSNWLTMEIVSLENLDERVALYSRLVDVMSVSMHIHLYCIVVYAWPFTSHFVVQFFGVRWERDGLSL